MNAPQSLDRTYCGSPAIGWISSNPDFVGTSDTLKTLAENAKNKVKGMDK